MNWWSLCETGQPPEKMRYFVKERIIKKDLVMLVLVSRGYFILTLTNLSLFWNQMINFSSFKCMINALINIDKQFYEV